MIGEWDSFVAEHADVFTKVTDMSALRAVKRSGKVGFIYNFQISAPFGWDLTKLDVFHSMGVRQIQLTGGRRNFLADSCWEPMNAGLSQFGYEVIHAFADKGILVDLSHVGERSALDAIQGFVEADHFLSLRLPGALPAPAQRQRSQHQGHGGSAAGSFASTTRADG